MKKLLVFLITCTIICACNSPRGTSKTSMSDNYVVKVIDGCEYIEVDKGMMEYRIYSLTHKGNCNNIIHKK